MQNAMKYSLILLAAVLLLPDGSLQAAGLGNNIVVRLVGTGSNRAPTAFEEDIIANGPQSPSTAGTMCFDLDIVDAKTDSVIGDATDCLSEVTADSDDGLYLTGTTFFNLPGGLVVSQGITTVEPIDEGSPNFTHITGAIPDPSDDSVAYGDGKFKKASGPVRLSGAVDMSGFDGTLGSPITFDCVFSLNVGSN
jgi:hypothetical protein